MSRFFSEKFNQLKPYTPGEQPQDMKYIKLNTNESPFAPSPKAIRAAAEAAERLQLYSDPESTALTQALASLLGVSREQVVCGNGSDELLNFAFMAFCDERTPAAFADITYGFYRVFAQINRVPYTIVPLREDFSLAPEDYFGLGKTIFIANPNAPTGRALLHAEVEQILRENPDHVVVIDEAYVDFGGESCVPLVDKYENLLVIQTFSKSRSLAGGRLGFAVGSRELIADLRTIQYSTNPYNVNAMTMAAGLGVLADEEYTKQNCRTIMENREFTTQQLQAMGFEVLDSKANFVFARHPRTSGKQLYLGLKERGVLVRHFDAPRISDYIRITIGKEEQMSAMILALADVLAKV